MSTDWYTKLVLTVVAACLVLLVVQGYRGGARASASGEGRYSVTAVPMARIMLRFDADTGRAWKAMLPELRVWTPIHDSPASKPEVSTPEAPEVPAPDVTPPEAGEVMTPEAREPRDRPAP